MESRFELYYPSEYLKLFVKKYYLFEGPNTGITNKIPAWTKSVLVLQCGGRLGANFDKGYQNIKPASINGSVLKPYTYDTDSAFFRFFVIEFTPSGLYALFRENTNCFTDTSVDVFDVIPGNKKQELIEALSELDDMNKKVAIVEAFLSQFLPKKNELFRIRNVQNTIELIENSNGTMSVDQISKELNFSSKHLRNGMKHVTGMTTKQFANLTRVQHVFNAVMDGEFNQAQLEALNSFYDQAHLLKEFKKYTGYTIQKIPKETYLFSRLFNL